MSRLVSWWSTVPAPTRAYLISLSHTIQAVICAMVTVGFSLGLCSTFDATVHYLITNAWAGFLAVAFGIGPYYRVYKAKEEQIQNEFPSNP